MIEDVKKAENFDKMLSALSSPYRRELLVALTDHNPQDDDDLDPLELLDDDTQADVFEMELVHNHLPKLEEMGYINWDRDTGQISKGPNWDEIAPLLSLIHNHRDELPDGWL